MNEIDLSAIKNIELKTKIEHGLAYRKNIAELISKQKESIRESLKNVEGDLDNWINTMISIAASVDKAEDNAVLKEDRLNLPAKVKALKASMRGERNPFKRVTLRRELEAKQGLLVRLAEMDHIVQQLYRNFDEVLNNMEITYNMAQKLEEARQKDSNS